MINMKKLLVFFISTTCFAGIIYSQNDKQFNVGQQTLEFKDAKRDRPVKTEIWYPTNDKLTNKDSITDYPFILKPTIRNAKINKNKLPLIVFSHGTGGNRISLMWLAHELAESGFIVAAVDHWGNTFDNKIPLNFVKIWDRPLDISFLIDELTKHPTFSKNINFDKIGAVGFSLGGYTVFALVGGKIDYYALKEFSKTKEGKKEFHLPELGDVSKLITTELIEEGKSKGSLKDERIKTVFAMAPALGQGFRNKNQLEEVKCHVFIIGSRGDKIAPAKTNAHHYHKLINGSGYYLFEGKAGHYVFMNEAKAELKKAARVIFKDHKTVNRRQVHKETGQKAIVFLKKELKY